MHSKLYNMLTAQQNQINLLSDDLTKLIEINKKLINQNELLQKQNEQIKETVIDSNQKLYRGDWEIHQNLKQYLYQECGLSSARYILKHMNNVPAFNITLDILSYAMEKRMADGLILEFGVYSGTTINHISSLCDQTVYGFDSFEGLPEDWRSGFEKGTFEVPELPKTNNNVTLVKGWFDSTLPVFVQEHSEKVSLLHIDCDLYSSTKCIFDCLKNQIVPGTIIVFDEYFNYPGWEEGEYKAFQEYIAESNLSYEYIGYVEIMEQVAVRIV